MYTIRFNRYTAEQIVRQCSEAAECIWEISEKARVCADSMEGMSGFGIDDIICDICMESKYVRRSAEDMLEVKAKTEGIIGIYEQAESRVRILIDGLPGLTNGSISGSGQQVMAESVRISSDVSAVCSQLLYDNTVVHEDWLTVLMAENKFGG